MTKVKYTVLTILTKCCFEGERQSNILVLKYLFNKIVYWWRHQYYLYWGVFENNIWVESAEKIINFESVWFCSLRSSDSIWNLQEWQNFKITTTKKIVYVSKLYQTKIKIWFSKHLNYWRRSNRASRKMFRWNKGDEGIVLEEFDKLQWSDDSSIGL